MKSNTVARVIPVAGLDRVIRNVLDSKADAYTLLGLLPTATPENVKEAHRSLASLLHPDRNPGNIGAAAAMAKVNEAYTLLTNETAKKRHDLLAGLNKRCGTCSGTGKENRTRGFKVHKVTCTDCKGTGKATPKVSLDKI